MVSHYRIVSKIGSGGMGEVFLADDTKLNRRVALKFLPSHLAADTILRARFTREVQAVAALNHPNIVHVYEVSEFNRRPFFAMEYVEGDPLRERMRVGKMPFDEALGFIIGLCEGLEAAHRVGIVHRDIKPANIVIASSGRVKILDFGLAKRASDPTLTSMGSTIGTICYMSPEQVQGKDSDNRSDLFSVGIVLYEMMAGRLPFRGDYDAATLTAIVSEPHEPLTKFRPDAPAHLSAVVNRLLAKEPALRYPNVTELLADLNRLRDELKYGARRDPNADKPGRRVPIGAIIAGTIVVVGVTVAAMLFMRSSDQPTVQVGSVDEGSKSLPTTPAESPASSSPEPRAPSSTTESVQQPVVDRSAYIAESISTAAESARLRALGYSFQRHQTRLAEQILAKTQKDTTARIAVNTLPVEPAPPVTATPKTTSRDRSADSVAINVAISQFWETLESGRVNDLRKTYPDMPKDWEKTWGTFVDFAKDLSIASSIANLKLNDPDAVTSNQVKMNYRNRGESKSENMRYSVRLSRKNGQWAIIEMERN